MQNLDVFLTRLMPQVPTCPRPLARQALVDSAVEFCEETGVIRYTSDPAYTESGVSTYYPDMPKYTEMSRVMRAWLDGNSLAIGPIANHHDIRSFQLYAPGEPGDPRYVTVKEANAVDLVPAPIKDNQPLVLQLITRPTQNAKQLDDQLFFRWREGVIAGAVLRITTTPGQPYSDPARASVAMGVWATQVNRARNEANRGSLGGSLTVQPRPIA